MTLQATASAKFLADVRARDAWAAEHGVTPGSAGDQAAALDFTLDNIVLPSGGRDRGRYRLPPGKIRLATKWVISRARGVIFQGAGWTRNNVGPRNHGGSANMSGTDLYWGGGAGGTCIQVDETNFATFEDFALYLDETSGGPQAALGFHFTNDNTFGHGRNTFRNVAINALAHGGEGMQFGTASSDLNIDTFYLERVQFGNLATACRWKHLQGLEWHFACPVFTNCNNWLQFEQGGNLFVYGFQAQESRNNQTIVICRVDEAGANMGTYHLFGGYLDRQGDNCYVTLFEASEAVLNTRFVAEGVNIRPPAGTVLAKDGTQRAFVEAHGGLQYTLRECGLVGQSVVRWRTSRDKHRRGVVRVSGGLVGNQKFGTELVTTDGGGYAGQVLFQNVARLQTGSGGKGVHETVSVNHFPAAGGMRTHWDIDNFDATDVPTQLKVPAPTDAVLQSTWLNSWLGGGHDDSPAWQGELRAYYSFSEPLAATTIKDRVNHATTLANDLTIDSDMQVANPPLPYLGQWCDWNQSDADQGRDTGVMVDPATDDLTVFGFFELETSSVGAELFTLVAASGDDYQILSCADTVGNLKAFRENAMGPAVKHIQQLNNFTPVFAVVSLEAATDTIRAFINGTQVLSTTGAGYAAAGSGSIWIGGNPANGRFTGKSSRCGIIRAFLSVKEATVLSLAASVIAERRHRNPL